MFISEGGKSPARDLEVSFGWYANLAITWDDDVVTSNACRKIQCQFMDVHGAANPQSWALYRGRLLYMILTLCDRQCRIAHLPCGKHPRYHQQR